MTTHVRSSIYTYAHARSDAHAIMNDIRHLVTQSTTHTSFTFVTVENLKGVSI